MRSRHRALAHHGNVGRREIEKLPRRFKSTTMSWRHQSYERGSEAFVDAQSSSGLSTSRERGSPKNREASAPLQKYDDELATSVLRARFRGLCRCAVVIGP